MKTPGFTAEVVLDPAIKNEHYVGLFTCTAEGDVQPMFWNWIRRALKAICAFTGWC